MYYVSLHHWAIRKSSYLEEDMGKDFVSLQNGWLFDSHHWCLYYKDEAKLNEFCVMYDIVKNNSDSITPVMSLVRDAITLVDSI